MIETVVISAAVGAASTLILESVIRPRIARRSLAELLAADLSMQAQLVVGELNQVRANKRTVPTMRPVTLQVYSTCVPRLGELPTRLIHDVLALYGVLARLNDISDRATEQYLGMRSAGGEDERQRAESELTLSLGLYEHYLESAIKQFNAVQPILYKCARPWWSLRYVGIPQPRSLNIQEAAGKVEALKRITTEKAAVIMSAAPPVT